MRALAILVLIASVSCKREENVAARADPEAKKGSTPAAIVISKKPPRVGLRVREERSIDMAYEFHVAGGTQHSGREETSTRVEEVLATDGMKVTKLWVTYEARDESVTVIGAPKSPRHSPVNGQTYIVDAMSDAGVVVTDAAGKPPPFDERTIVENDYHALATEDLLAKGLPDTPLHVGDRVPTLVNAMMNRILGIGAGDVESEIDVTVDHFEDHASIVVFKVNGKLTFGSAKMSIPMEMTMNVRTADGWLSEYAMKGTMHLGDGGPTTSSGTTKVAAKRTYLP